MCIRDSGASASLCSHAATDFTKQAKIKSIAYNDHNLITALSNDYGFEMWVQKALQFYASSSDLIFFISVSGNSPNLINGLKYAKKAIVLILSNIEDSVNLGTKKSRSNMLYASHLAGKAINITKTTACHATSYPMTSYFGVSHGK